MAQKNSDQDLKQFIEIVENKESDDPKFSDFHYRRIDSEKMVEFNAPLLLPKIHNIVKSTESLGFIKNKQSQISRIWNPTSIDLESFIYFVYSYLEL